MSLTELPESLKPHFREYGPIIFNDKTAVAWGFTPNKHLGASLWKEAEQYGTWYCLEMGSWVLVTRWLTPEEAAETYGPLTDIDDGSGGKTVYGTTHLWSKWVQPTTEMLKEFLIRNKPVNYEWVVRVTIRPKEDKPHIIFTPSPKELRDLANWYSVVTDVHERMIADGWKAHSEDRFERVESEENGYTRDRLKTLLKGVNVSFSGSLGRLRQERRRKEANQHREPLNSASVVGVS